MIRALAATLAFSALALAAQPMPADAHGPSRQKVTKTIEINAPVDKVWKIVAIEVAQRRHPGAEVVSVVEACSQAPGGIRDLQLALDGAACAERQQIDGASVCAAVVVPCGSDE